MSTIHWLRSLIPGDDPLLDDLLVDVPLVYVRTSAPTDPLAADSLVDVSLMGDLLTDDQSSTGVHYHPLPKPTPRTTQIPLI